MLNLKNSCSYKAFKRDMGQQNHLYITLLMGISCLESTDAHQYSQKLHTLWNPKNLDASIARSRQYASKSALSWCVNLLEVYMNNCNIDGMYSPNLKKKYDGTERSVYKKFLLLYEELSQKKDFQRYASLVALGIQWRNRMIHSMADNELDNQFVTLLIENKEFINTNFCGLDIDATLRSFKNSDAPSLKETTSIVRATHKLVEQMDNFLLENLDIKNYAKKTIDDYLRQNPSRIAKVTRQNPIRKLSVIKQVLLNKGFCIDVKHGLTDADLEKLLDEVLNVRKVS